MAKCGPVTRMVEVSKTVCSVCGNDWKVAYTMTINCHGTHEIAQCAHCGAVMGRTCDE